MDADDEEKLRELQKACRDAQVALDVATRALMQYTKERQAAGRKDK